MTHCSLVFLMACIAALLVGCGGPNFRMQENEIPREIADGIPATPLVQKAETGSSFISNNQTLSELPEGGLIPPKGPHPEVGTCGINCSCDTVKLARVTTQDIEDEGTWWLFGLDPREWLPPVVQYQLGDASTPPETGPLSFPERRQYDRVCFFFTFPECDAYWRWAGDNRGCTAKVNIRWPVSNSTTGWREYTWQLYGVQGWQFGDNKPEISFGPTSMASFGDFRNGTPNLVCLSVHFDGFQIPPGQGKVTWSAENNVCDPGVDFEVTPRP